MSRLLFELPLTSAARSPAATALRHAGHSVSYAELADSIEAVAHALVGLGVGRLERVAVYLPKQPETVSTLFGASRAGCVFVPVNPVLKAEQVGHILRDCNVRVLVTTAARCQDVREELALCPDLRCLVIVGDGASVQAPPGLAVHGWADWLSGAARGPLHRVIDADMTSILYTSGSTGKPKGVVLSHKNMVTGAESVASYLENVPDDRLLAVLPFSFDYGFSQLSTAFSVGASVVLLEHLFAKDVIRAAARERATALAGVPPLWIQLADLDWPAETQQHLRYITNSGGAMTRPTLDKLRAKLPNVRPFLMYGLTEAFRSTYLPPSEVDRRPGSMGKAIPNAEILVVHPDGTPCKPGESGELVHRGSLVGLGYWNDPEKTAERYKPVPGQLAGLVLTELAVWSGDTVRIDEDGFLYFLGRRDEMIKTSGYRVSPSEVEEALYRSGLVAEAVALGVPHPTLGHAIVVVAVAGPGAPASGADALIADCRRRLPAYMVPAHVAWRDALPKNANGKFDRAALAAEFRALYETAG